MVKMEKQPIDWITVNGNHVPIFEGQSKKNAVSKFFNEKMQKQGLYTDEGSENDDVKKNPTFINIQLFANKGLEKLGNIQLKKSIISWEKEINEHKEKINNPRAIYKNWDELDDAYKERIIRKWGNEIRAFNDDIKIAKMIIKRRKKDLE